MSIAAFIPIKQNSERVPGKNLRHLAGRPLYQYIIEAACGSGVFSDVYVDTDSDEISQHCRDIGGAVNVTAIERDPALNDANGNQLLMHHWQRYPGYQMYFQLFATAPLLKSSTIEKAADALCDNAGDTVNADLPWTSAGRNDSVLTVHEQTGWFWFRGQPVNYRPGVLPKSQHAEKVIQETTGLYGITEHSLLNFSSRIGESPLMFPVSADEALDIDSEEDFLHAEYLLQRNLVEA